MDEKRLAELEALCAEATPGPWKAWTNAWLREQTNGKRLWLDGPDTHPEGDESPWRAEDATFVAYARTALPELVAEVRRLRGIVAAAGIEPHQHVFMRGSCVTPGCDATDGGG